MLFRSLLVATALLAAAGVDAYLNLPIDAFPDVSSTQVKIILKAPGMTPEEVETRIAVPVEQEMLGIPRQRLLRSMSKYALTDITIDFEDGTDIYWARSRVLEYLNGIADGSSKKIAILHNVEDFREIREGLAIVASDRTLKTITFKEMAQQTEVNLNIDAHSLNSVTDLPGNYTLVTSPFCERLLVTRCCR